MKNSRKHKLSVIGIDQSYKRTGISIASDGKLSEVGSLDMLEASKDGEGLNEKNSKRLCLETTLANKIKSVLCESEKVVCVMERIRLRSNGFLNIDYIKSIGALNAVICDVMDDHGIKTYSVDTRCWKASVVGTSKPRENEYGVNPNKWPTVEWCMEKGFEDEITREVTGRRTKGTFELWGARWEYDDDASDSAAIAMFPFVGDRSKLKLEL